MPSYLVNYSPRPAARFRLAAFHHAGGAASFYRPWVRLVPADVDLVCGQLPGREQRLGEPFATDIGPLAAAFADALADDPRPLTLFGHSFGAVVAYEVARLLEARDRPPAHLCVSAYLPPHLPPPVRDPTHWGVAEFRALLVAMGGTTPELLDDADLMAMAVPRLRADYRLARAYCPLGKTLLSVPITAFGGRTDPFVAPEPLAEWRHATAGEFQRREYDGGHFYLLDHAAEVVAETLATLADPWHATPTVPPLREAGVQVWRIRLTADDATLAALRADLSPAEIARADRFVRPADGRRFAVARAALRRLIGAHTDTPPAAVPLRLGRGGKPEVPGAVRFNLSHTGDLALLALSCHREVGIDAETERADLDHDALAERYFAPEEVAALAALPNDARRVAFFRVWSRKEAFVKAVGLGLTIPLDGFAVPVDGRREGRLLHTRFDPAQQERWHLRRIDADPGVAACLVTDGPPGLVTCWDWSPALTPTAL